MQKVLGQFARSSEVDAGVLTEGRAERREEKLKGYGEKTVAGEEEERVGKRKGE